MKSLESIPNFYRINEALITSGQPSESDFSALANQGYRLIINLALPDSPGALRDEAKVVEEAGCDYQHLPVSFNAPKKDDLERFFLMMETHADRKKLIHCAYNWRVSAFVYLYRVIKQGAEPQEALKDLRAVWVPNPTWQAFIDERLKAAKS